MGASPTYRPMAGQSPVYSPATVAYSPTQPHFGQPSEPYYGGPTPGAPQQEEPKKEDKK